jgi:hypothetical protein
MHPTIHEYLAKARTADLHRQAQRDALARTASKARRAPAHQRSHRLRRFPAVTARRVITALTGSP